jgi:hypothetical protein
MKRLAILAAVGAVLPFSGAQAIPAFARKYGTSCQTCHTVYPKLTPFGEAFRRNGFRFPGVDSDYVKQDTITLAPKTATSDPTTLTAIPPLAFGFNGQAIFHPDKNTSGAAADNHAQANLSGLVEEAHVWTGGTLNDKVSYFGEVTLSADGVDVEHAQVYFNDLLGPQHALNVRVGRGFANVSSFGPHSSFLADALMPPSGVAALNGAAGGGWTIGDHYNGVEASGVVGGRLDYNAGWNAGTGADLRSAEDVYGHVGYKIGGMRLDGEGATNATNAARPWEETAVTLDAFAYHALSSADFGDAGIVLDTINTVGGGIRVQFGSLELNSGLVIENHKRAEPGLTSASYLSQYNELSYIVVPWLVPAVRFEYSKLSPDSACVLPDTTACASVSDWRLWPGVALLPYPNLKVVVTAMFESASGAPPGGWGAVGGFGSGDPGVGTEFQNVQVFTAFAF